MQRIVRYLCGIAFGITGLALLVWAFAPKLLIELGIRPHYFRPAIALSFLLSAAAFALISRPRPRTNPVQTRETGTSENPIDEQTMQFRGCDESYRILVESIKDCSILMLDPHGRITSWSPGAERISGYKAEEIIGRSFDCLYTEEDAKSGHPQDILRSAESNGNFEEDGWQVRKNGSVFWANVVVTPVRGDSGELRGFSKMTRDITVRRSVEQQLQESEQQFRLLLECAPDAIVIVDHHGHLVLINAQAEKLFGYDREELIGEDVEILVPDSLRHTHARHRAEYGHTPHVRQMGSGLELMGLRKNGELFPVEVSLSPIQTSRAAWIAAGIRDITERKEAEKRLIAERKRAEEANRSKSDFLAAMSHEIRTPMNAILGLADLLWETDLSQIQRDYVGRFRRAGTNLLTLLNDILDLSKIESGRFELESIDFCLAELVDRTMELLAPRATTKKIELTAHISPGTPTVVIGDPGRLQQLLNNIVGNAIKFTQRGGVTLSVKSHPDNQPGHLQFRISDTGIGIPSDKLTAIFEDFIQAESSTTRRFGGTGLGLGICSRLVKRMGGDLTVESELGKGSTFTFDIFLAPGDVTSKAEGGEVGDLIGRKVLIVDDNATNRLILAQTCASWGMVVLEAANAEKACELTREATETGQKFSLVLLDNIMHGTNGFEVLEQLLRIDSTLPVILTSSDKQPGDMTKAKGMGAAAYALKPLRRSELLSLISGALGWRQEKGSNRMADFQTPALGRMSGSPMKILVAEDSEDNRFLVAAYLGNRPYDLTFAENGKQALELFTNGRFDLVLMDIQMPVMDGLEATASIRAFERERSAAATPIVALTANALVEDAERSQEAGCDTHLSKPISKEKLVAVIESFRRTPAESDSNYEDMPVNKINCPFKIPEGFEELSRNYIASRRREISHMLELPPGQGFEELRVFGHNMKGNGAPFGFPELTTLGAAIEAAAKASHTAQIDVYLSRVKEYVEYASQALSSDVPINY